MTWTTYESWLPGDERGFVSNVRVGPGPEVRHNILGTPPDTRQRGLYLAAVAQMNGPPVYLTMEHADLVFEQFRETAHV